MIRYFATRYSAWTHSILVGWNSAWTHSILVGWNLIVGFWIGSQAFRDQVAGLQHDLHLPTWIPALFTGLVNITLAYRTWTKQR